MRFGDSRYEWTRIFNGKTAIGPSERKAIARWMRAWDAWEARVVGFRLAAGMFLIAAAVGMLVIPDLHLGAWLAVSSGGFFGALALMLAWTFLLAPSLDDLDASRDAARKEDERHA